MKGAFWMSSARLLGLVCATTWFAYISQTEMKNLHLQFKLLKRKNMQIALAKLLLVILDANLRCYVAAPDCWQMEEKSRLFSSHTHLPYVFLLLYFISSMCGIWWECAGNFMRWKAKLINNERLVLFRKGLCNTQDTEQFSSCWMLARHTYFKSLMHHRCREEVCA